MPIAKSSPYRALFEEGSPCIRMSEEGNVEEVNPSFRDFYGWTLAELRAKGLGVLAPKDVLPREERPFDPSLALSAGRREDIAVLAKQTKDPILCEIEVKRPKEGGSFISFHDVRARRAMERELFSRHRELRHALAELECVNGELRSAQESLVLAGKLAALGELVAGVTHELNQPLQGILGYAQELEAEVMGSIPENAQANLSEIISNARKMGEILRDFRKFTKKPVEELEDTDVTQSVDEALKLLKTQFNAYGIKVIRDYGKDLPRVRANPVQLQQVFINLGANARDAIHATRRGEGTITVTARPEGEFVEVRFRDDGCGMSETTRKKIFDPFFSTKEVGQGMGIGLSISHGILKNHHAAVAVESQEGKFTEFRIRFPVAGAVENRNHERRSA